ncbi:MAG: anhydro-N-acetylmuramic acid kinase [Tenacibaculum sp.]|nr:anhydro-N-acetylmuramic acid kinase [Tenacibaculum sp.]
MQNPIYIIGLMSGTSLDGIDVIYTKFDKENYKNFEIIFSDTIKYSTKWKEDLANGISFSQEKLKQLDVDYGKLLANEINNFISKNKITKIDFIASHGHTIFHQPEKGITLQIGNGQEISNQTNTKVICDFRTQDVKLGGQGAPLVPVGDELLFSNYKYCINLGGFANVSFKEENKRIAFDVCPVNIVLNYYVQKIGLEYDDKGTEASKGNINSELLKELNSLDFYDKKPPKSLGLEWVKEIVFPIIDKYNLPVKDILRTFIEHIAFQIGTIIKGSSSVLITGGGVFNSFLISRIEYYTEKNIDIPVKQLIEYKEALIFAFLGLLRSKNEVNCLKSVTGASKNHSSGEIFLPK